MTIFLQSVALFAEYGAGASSMAYCLNHPKYRARYFLRACTVRGKRWMRGEAQLREYEALWTVIYSAIMAVALVALAIL